MAVIQYTALIAQMRGKISGTVLSKYSTGFNAYAKGSPRKLKTQAQLTNMQGMSINARLWNELTPLEKSDWEAIAATKPVSNRIGETVYLSGYHYYRKVLQAGWPEGKDSALQPNALAGTAQEISFAVTTLELENTPEGWQFNSLVLDGLTLNNTSVNQLVTAWISNPIASEESNYFGTYYRIGSDIQFGEGAVGAPVNIVLSGAVISPGFYSFFEAFHKIRLQYLVPASGSFSVPTFASKMASVVVPVVFPPFYSDNIAAIAVSGPTGGLMDYYWKSDFKAQIIANFDIEQQFAIPQPTNGPVDPNNWLVIYTVDFTALGGADSLVPAEVARNTPWYNVWWDTTNLYYTPFVDFYQPMRARLKDKVTGQLGEWTLGYWDIFET